MFVFVLKQYLENFAFLILRNLELFTRKDSEMFVYKHTETTVYLKVAYFLRKTQTSRVNKSSIIMIKNAKFSGYYFCMN